MAKYLHPEISKSLDKTEGETLISGKISYSVPVTAKKRAKGAKSALKI
jgi:hypothetical protein